MPLIVRHERAVDRMQRRGDAHSSAARLHGRGGEGGVEVGVQLQEPVEAGDQQRPGDGPALAHDQPERTADLAIGWLSEP
jgi:hypothetical protein